MALMPGVYLRYIPTNKFKTGCFSFNFLRPLCREEAAANALFTGLLLRGTEKYPNIRSISHRLDDLYGAAIGALTRKKGDVQATGFYVDFIEDALVDEPVFAPVVELLGEILLHPLTTERGFSPEIFAGEQENLRNAIIGTINNKRGYAIRRLTEEMFAGENYSLFRLGDVDTLAQLTPEGLYAHYRKVLAQSPIEIIYIGRQPQQAVAQSFRRMLSPLPREGSFSLPALGQKEPPCRELRTTVETMPLSQSKLAMGFWAKPGTTPQTFGAYMVLNAIYGVGFRSKLFTHVREKRSLCYYAGSSYERYKGIFLVSSGISAQQFDMARDEMLHQLEECRQGHISAEELSAAKQLLLSALRVELDEPARQDDFYIGQTLLGVDFGIEALMAAVEATDLPAVIDAAQAVRPDTIYFLREAAK